MAHYLYLSDYTTVTLGERIIRKARAHLAGADGPQIPITDTRCVVFSRTLIAFPPPGVRFMLDLQADANTPAPNAAVNAVNNQLGTNYPTQTYTWRQLLREVFRELGYTRLDFSFGSVTL